MIERIRFDISLSLNRMSPNYTPLRMRLILAKAQPYDITSINVGIKGGHSNQGRIPTLLLDILSFTYCIGHIGPAASLLPLHLSRQMSFN